MHQRTYAVIVAIWLIAQNTIAHAEGPFAGFGVGVFNSAKNSAGETKIGEVGYREDILGGLMEWQYKGAFWGDGSGDPSRRSSFMVSTGPVFTVKLKPVEARTSWGLAAISNPDSYLGGRFPQFNGEFYLGVRDDAGRAIGVKYEHVSSAGLRMPNLGRDFMLLEIGLGW